MVVAHQIDMAGQQAAKATTGSLSQLQVTTHALLTNKRERDDEVYISLPFFAALIMLWGNLDLGDERIVGN
jgi:hypothetical protein